MSVPPKIFIKHPLTKELVAAKEAARFIGITTATLYQRLRKGDTGTQLWRTNESNSKLPKETKQMIQDRSALLAEIPEPTKFDNL